ncbi:NfrA family protein [Dyella sp.]|uniref:NfrA family protein n=1 Tax=Dyella sp. TaxID=1869338 RepID=UPI003F8182D0
MTRSRWQALMMLPLTLGAPAFAQQPVRVDDVSAYRRFLIYPHQQRAFAAMKAGDQATAIAEFTRARELAPRSVTTALDLAEAWRHFQQPARAEGVLAEQRRFTPDDPRLTPHATAVRDCRADPAAVCRAQRGYDALRAGELDRVQAELDDTAFARSDTGVALRRALAQRAIYLGEAARADAAFAALQEGGYALQPAERAQWFALLLQLREVAAAAALQEAHADLQTPMQQLAMAHALGDAGQAASLVSYLAAHQPAFAREVQERQWLYLLAHVEANRPDLLTRYRVRFAANRAVQARLALPGAMARDDRAAAQRALAQLPPGDFGEARFGLALRAGRLDEALRQAQRLVARRDGARQLDALSYRLIDAGATAQGKLLLMQAYPFADADTDHAAAMLQRLALIGAAQPELFDATDRARLRAPLGTAALRNAQVPLLASLEDCDGVRMVMDDFDPSYAADRWAALGQCLHDSRPGLAEYAYAQASQRAPGGDYTRALAYQAYATQDYPVALDAWGRVDLAQMSADDRLAAATTAIAAGDAAAARQWLDRFDAAGGARQDSYWWLRAQAASANDAAAAEAALQQAIALRPDARYYARLAQLQRARGAMEEAAGSLERASALVPQDAALAAGLGYTWLQIGDRARARPALERAHRLQPADPNLTRQLMYLELAQGDRAQARTYAAQAIDQLDGRGDGPAAQDDAGDDRVELERFNLRRLHEDLGRRWRILGDLAIGDSVSSAANAIAPGVSYRSYAQVEAQYRFDAPSGGDENTLAAYARVFAGSGAQGDWQPVHAPRLGVGVHWKPWRSQTIIFSAEQQLGIGRVEGRRSDTLLRASGSWTGGARFSDDWHPEGRGWFAQNVYVDVARYLRAQQSVATLDYQWGYHRKLPAAQTLEPFVRLQANGIERGHGQGFGHDLRAGLGVRWNLWYGESRYDAYAHRVRVGLEWQHAFTSYLRETNVVFLTVGGQW